MKTAAKILKNMAILVVILLAGFLCLHIQEIFENNELIPTIFALCVFLIAVFTDGYFYGVLASVCSVLAVNYAFTFPYFRINFTIPQNMVSAVIMIAITLITCGITNKIKYQEQIKEESEKEKMRAICSVRYRTIYGHLLRQSMAQALHCWSQKMNLPKNRKTRCWKESDRIPSGSTGWWKIFCRLQD